MQQNFGGDWTKEKLERLRKYLVAYTKIFKANPRAQFLHTTYVDAFAGTGDRSARRLKPASSLSIFAEEDPERDALLKGSARIALETEPPFDTYLFIERKPEFTESLRQLAAEFPLKEASVTITQGEANHYLEEWCRTMDWRKNRAVVFLDPYGMQVDWTLIEAIAETKAIDLWILFPLGTGVSRLLTKGDPPPEEWKQALTRCFGTGEWEKAFYSKKTDLSLFGPVDMVSKDTDFDGISRFFVDRLKTVFAKVAENPLPLYNSKNVPLYLFCFAAGNPKSADKAVKIAEHILRRPHGR